MRGIDRRLGLLFCGFLLIFSFAIARSFWLQGVRGGALRAEAHSQQVTQVTIPGSARPRARSQRQGAGGVRGRGGRDRHAVPGQEPGPDGAAAARPPGGAHHRPGLASSPTAAPASSTWRGRWTRTAAARVKKLDIAGRLDGADQPPALPAGRARLAGDRRRRDRQPGPDRARALRERRPRRGERRAGRRPRRARPPASDGDREARERRARTSRRRSTRRSRARPRRRSRRRPSSTGPRARPRSS